MFGLSVLPSQQDDLQDADFIFFSIYRHLSRTWHDLGSEYSASELLALCSPVPCCPEATARLTEQG